MAKAQDSKPKKSRAKGRTAAEQFATAQRRIEEARKAGTTGLHLRDLRKLAALPPELSGLTALVGVNLKGTQVSDLAPLAGATALQSLNLMGTQVSDLAPLAGLTALQSLTLWNTQVSDLAPLAGLTALQGLDLGGTQVGDLTPLSGLTALQSLDLKDTQVSDLAPLADLTALQSLYLAGTTALQSLRLTGTQVSDLAPLAEMTRMLDAITSTNAIRRGRADGLSYAGTPVSRTSPFDRLVQLDQPARTVETINEVRRRRGLREHIPEGYERPANIAELLGDPPSEDTADPSEVETAAALEQRPATFSFPYANGRFRARAQISAPADLPLASDIYSELKAKALEARSRLARSNRPSV